MQSGSGPQVSMTRKQESPTKELSLFDSTCLIVGIIIGAGIYQMAPAVAQSAGGGWGVMAIWVVGGLISLCGALSYAELAAAYPHQGGDYVYLSQAYGPWAGFLFGWVQLAVVRPGDIAVMAFAFAMYARTLYDPLAGTPFPYALRLYAGMAVVLFTLVNILGVREGKWTQNVLTLAKAIGLLALVGVALVAPPPVPAAPPPPERGHIPLSLGLIFVLFTFGGWNEMAYVAAEVRDHRRNIVRALVLGTGTVTVLYLLVNWAFLSVLGYSGVVASDAVATDTVARVFPTAGGRMISVLVCVSALGALNGLIFTGARISYAVGVDHRVFRRLGLWHPRTGTPVPALALQGALAILLIVALGSFVDTIIYTASAVYLFYLATSLAVIVLRRKEPHVERPYRVTGYPFTTILFCAVCTFLMYSASAYALENKPWILPSVAGTILMGIILYVRDRRRTSDTRPAE